MMRCRTNFIVFLFAFFSFGCLAVFSQVDEQEVLEAKREQLQKEIDQINLLLFDQKEKKGNVLEQMEALNQKIDVRQRLIDVTNQQSNLLDRKINTNVNAISELRSALAKLKEDYALMIQKGYQSKIQQSKLMFLLSSENFFQAFKRLQYIKQYTDFRRKQGEEIVIKTDTLTQLNIALSVQRKQKERLIAENRSAKREMEQERNSQQTLLGSIRKDETKYAYAIRDKQRETKEIDQQIEKLIKEAIAAENAASGKDDSDPSKFLLTPEAAIVANSFTANKGKMIWPVEKGFKSQGYGVYADAIGVYAIALALETLFYWPDHFSLIGGKTIGYDGGLGRQQKFTGVGIVLPRCRVLGGDGLFNEFFDLLIDFLGLALLVANGVCVFGFVFTDRAQQGLL